jgi:hypothetical protein
MHYTLCRDMHGLARLGIAPNARRAQGSVEAPEAAHLHFAAVGQCGAYRVENAADGQLYIFGGEMRVLLADSLDEFGTVHDQYILLRQLKLFDKTIGHQFL